MTVEKRKIRIIIADDHHIFRKGIISILKGDDSIELVGESPDGLDALEKIRSLKPDIALLDIDMPGMNGLEVARAVQKDSLDVKIAVLTMHKEKEYFNEALKINVKAFLLKDKISDDLIECIRTISEDKYFISPQISTYLVEAAKKEDKPAWLKLLTNTELSILRLVAENKTSAQIAEELFNSIRTIENHRSNICKKLGLTGQHALLLFAIENKHYM
jgi:DNA-binding NarL/FixJ family response regulator